MIQFSILYILKAHQTQPALHDINLIHKRYVIHLYKNNLFVIDNSDTNDMIQMFHATATQNTKYKRETKESMRELRGKFTMIYFCVAQ